MVGIRGRNETPKVNHTNTQTVIALRYCSFRVAGMPSVVSRCRSRGYRTRNKIFVVLLSDFVLLRSPLYAHGAPTSEVWCPRYPWASTSVCWLAKSQIRRDDDHHRDRYTFSRESSRTNAKMSDYCERGTFIWANKPK